MPSPCTLPSSPASLHWDWPPGVGQRDCRADVMPVLASPASLPVAPGGGVAAPSGVVLQRDVTVLHIGA